MSWNKGSSSVVILKVVIADSPTIQGPAALSPTVAAAAVVVLKGQHSCLKRIMAVFLGGQSRRLLFLSVLTMGLAIKRWSPVVFDWIIAVFPPLLP